MFQTRRPTAICRGVAAPGGIPGPRERKVDARAGWRLRRAAAHCCVAVWLGAFLSISPLHAAEANEPGQVVKLALTPRDEPRPALRYELLPDLADLQPENAAVYYYKALAVEGPDPLARQEFWDLHGKWMELPLAELPKAAVRKEVENFRRMLDEVDRAALCDHCHWADPIREQGAFTLLPQIQKVRNFARVLALKARLEVAEGRLDDALKTIQSGLALAQHLAQGESLVHGLVGIAIAARMFEDLEHLVAHPDAPNLYWSLTMLPRPLVPMRKALAAERRVLEYTIPEVKEMERRIFTSEEAKQVARKFNQISAMTGDLGDGLGPWSKTGDLGLAALALTHYPRSRANLLAAGRAPDQVDRMPVMQVIMLDTSAELRQVVVESQRWMLAAEFYGGRGAEYVARAKAAEQTAAHSPTRALLPAFHATAAASLRHVGTVDVLRVIEAIRIYAARHGGSLPGKLDDIREVPVPIDAVSGEPFRYRREGDTAVLDQMGYGGSSDLVLTRFELTIRK